MKKTELRKLISQYKEVKQKQKKKNHSDNLRLANTLKQIEHRYFHETGRTLKSDLKTQKKIEQKQVL